MSARRIDPRIAEALQTIGSIVDNDAGFDHDLDYAAVQHALTILAEITRLRAEAAAQRLAGNIGIAVRIDANIDRAFERLPGDARW
ncbi:MAG: hypothetical protein EHM24_09120 [Acidobacteria bacterium]|nr:MAG: hypothetical protein EHM24_09120 [Acidobacteriota bacterium]